MFWPFEDDETLEMIASAERERKTTYGKFKHNYLHPWRDVVVGLTNDFLSVDFTDLFWIFFFLVAVASSMSLLYWLLRPRVVKGIYYLRGIHVVQPEAAVPGSPLRPGTSIPSFMLEVYKPGILIDTFVGYGIRVGEVLVMPMHVFAAACQEDRVLLKGRNRVSAMLQVIESRKCNDVAYSLLDVNTWSKLGTQRASVLETVERSVPVTIYGREGTAAGYASKSPIPHVLTFSGSTLPGYSGSAYVSNGAAYGMHIGVAMEGNIGVSLQSISHEISSLIKGEKKRGPKNIYLPGESYEGLSQTLGPKKTWKSSQAAFDYDEEELLEQYAADETARDKSFDAWLKGESSITKEMFQAFSEMSITQLESVINLAKNSVAEKKASTTKIFKTQGPDSFDAVLQVSDEDEDELGQAVAWCVKEINQLKTEVKLLADKISAKGEAPQPKARPYSCQHCSSSFTSKIGMLMHNAVKHVETESAFPADHQVTEKLKPVAFLGKTSLSMKRKSKPSSSTSSTSIPGVASTSDLKSLSKTKPSPSQLAEYLEALVKIISGLKEESQQ